MAVATLAVLGALIANAKSCSMSRTVEEYAFENDSLGYLVDSLMARGNERTDSVVVVLDRHERIIGGDKKQLRKLVARVRRVRTQKPWWQVW